MDVKLYFSIIWYILMLPIVFKVLLAMNIEQIFKKGSTVEIRLFYMIATVIVTKLFVDYFINLGNLMQNI